MIAQIGVAVVMFPILKRQSERLALGYVASRTMESAMVGVGLIAMLSILTLRGDLAASVGANGESLEIAGRTLVSIHDWTFLMGPGFCVGVNDLLLGYLMYTTGRCRGDQQAGRVLQYLAETDFTGHVVLEVNSRKSGSRAQREADLAESLAFARLHLAAPVHPSYAVDGGGVASAL